MTRPPMQKDLCSKSLAGGVLGLTFAFACSGIYIRLAIGLPLSIKAQLAMWMVMPIWLTTFSLVYLFRSGARAWLGLGSLNLIAWLGLAALPAFPG